MAVPEYSEGSEDNEDSPEKKLDLEDPEIEQKLKDELDEEVDKKFKTQIREDYSDDYPADDDYLK